MLDISNKTKTLRTAVAKGTLKLKNETIELIHQGKIPKGDPLTVAKVAAIQAAKNTSQILPYCHPLPVDYVGVEFEIGDAKIEVDVTVIAIYKTGVEMEALTAVSIALLTLYDMMKMLDEDMEILSVRLISKKGGESDFKTEFKQPLKAAVLVMSDSISSGKGSDESGKMIEARLMKEGVEVLDYKIIPDDTDMIKSTIINYADVMKLDLVITTGGTGFSPRDFSPEATSQIIEREIPGIPEVMRFYGQERTPYSMLSRGKAGIRGNTIMVNLPGSKKGVAESLDALFPGLLHAFKMLWMERH
ncbi:MAG: bifunctional molybdenum cofactor biosynthesis protein MoaC/MoaB [Bacteroidetes bacterium]|nr:bifunctional molybdenum cofactor biosynthesis protein MoaC/MoaB [Bacteroidota bacterium]MBU1422653.1 bifunctional molybdenum cofactor biosynthesis protein MoaC/MoaB [Bacteroidota bacterium]